MLKALLKIVVGFGLVAAGIALEGVWLAFCFGTIVVGIILLIWFSPILLLPFALLAMPGWRILNNGLHELRPLNVNKISAAIAPLIDAQIEEIESAGDVVPLDERVLVYVAALAFVASRRNLSLVNVIDITSKCYSAPKYKLSVQNLRFCVDYSDDLRAFWKSAQVMTPVAQRELASGRGNVLVQLSLADRKAIAS